MKLKVIDEYKSELLLSKYLPVVKSFSYTLNKFKSVQYENKCAIFVKIISNKAVHKVKSDALYQINSQREFIKQKSTIVKRAKQLKAKRILVQEKICGEELIVGIKDDAKFGKLLMCGIGGRFAEQLNDVSFRLLPLAKKDFHSMLNDLKNQAIITKLDTNKLWLFTQKLISFATKHKEIQFIDLNPVIVESNSKKPIIVDARIYTK